MTTKGGFGLTAKIKISTTMTAIVAILDGEIPEFEKFVAEMTGVTAPAIVRRVR